MPERGRDARGRETYTLRLKRGVCFSDDPCFAATGGKGREVVAADLAYAFQRIADPAVECPVLSVLQEPLPGLGEAYAAAKASGRFDYGRPLPDVEVVDRYTLRLHLAKPYPQVLYWLAMPFAAPVPREAVEYHDGKAHGGETREQFRFHPVGTGAFRLAEWRRNRLIRLERRPGYSATRFPTGGWASSEEARFRPLAGRPLPLIDELQFSIIRENIPRWLLFRQGWLDSSGVSKDVFGSVLDAARELTPAFRARGVRLHRDASPSTFWLVFNMTDPLLGKNRKLRQAIASAYDRELANEVFFNGIFLNAEQVVPPGVFGHQADLRSPWLRHDLALARKLLAEAGWPDGRDPATGRPLELTLDTTVDDPESRQMAEFEKSQIEQLGIRVKVVENLWARQQDKVDGGHFQVVTGGWQADYPDPENFLMLFAGRNAPPRGSNHSRYANPEFDRLFDRMSAMDNTPERREIVRRLVAILNEDCPVVLLTHPVTFALSQPWAPRVTSNPLVANAAKYVSVDAGLRDRLRREWNRAPTWPAWAAALAAAAAVGGAFFWSAKRDA
jgi:ABC-type transport system substrate-binding protein